MEGVLTCMRQQWCGVLGTRDAAAHPGLSQAMLPLWWGTSVLAWHCAENLVLSSQSPCLGEKYIFIRLKQ